MYFGEQAADGPTARLNPFGFLIDFWKSLTT